MCMIVCVLSVYSVLYTKRLYIEFVGEFVCVTKRNKTLNAHKNCSASNHIRLNFGGLYEWNRALSSHTIHVEESQDDGMQQPYQFIDVASNFLWHSQMMASKMQVSYRFASASTWTVAKQIDKKKRHLIQIHIYTLIRILKLKRAYPNLNSNPNAHGKSQQKDHWFINNSNVFELRFGRRWQTFSENGRTEKTEREAT